MSKDITIIAFVGKKKSGKSTAGKYLVEKYDYVRVRFAETLKAMLYEFGLNDEELDGSLKEVPCVKLGGKTPVQAMQTLGTEWGRDLMYPNIWVDALDRELKFHIEMGLKRFVIDDLRFANEKEYFDGLREKYNVRIARIERDGTDSGSHKSETEMDSMGEVDYHINNKFSLEMLHNTIDMMLKYYEV